MTAEHLPENEIELVNQLVEAAIQRCEEGMVIGTVHVAYDQPAWESGEIWVKASCSECPATSLLRCNGRRSSLVHLAHLVRKKECLKYGHNNSSLNPA